MKFYSYLSLVVLVFLTVGSSLSVLSAADDSSVKLLLQKAYFAQKSEGDINKAIELYSQVISQNDNDMEYAAQACYRLGQCYLDSGNKDSAVEYFTKVVKNYSSIEKWASKAQEKLDEMGVVIRSDQELRILELLPKEAIDTVDGIYKSICQEAQKLRFSSNVHYYIVKDSDVIWGWINSYYNAKDQEESGKIFLGTTSYQDTEFYSFDGRMLEPTFQPVIGKEDSWKVYSKPKVPIPAKSFYGYFTVANAPKKISYDAKGDLQFTMQNNYGSSVLEAFILLVPKDYSLTDSSVSYESSIEAANYNIYYFKKKLPYGRNHEVDVKVSVPTSADSSGLNLLPVPWANGDSFTLDINMKTGIKLGDLTYNFNTADKNGVKCWEISSTQNIKVNGNNIPQDTVVYADCKSYAPVAGVTESSLGTFSAEYGDKKVTLQVNDKPKKLFNVDGIVYDNEQVLCMLRLLPLSENYSCSFSIFPVQSGVITESKVKVLAKEAVKVPAGEFNCYKISLACWINNIKALEHYVWISDDQYRNIVKYDSTSAEMVLSKFAAK